MEIGLPGLLISTWIMTLMIGKVFFNRFVSQQQTEELEQDFVLQTGLSRDSRE